MKKTEAKFGQDWQETCWDWQERCVRKAAKQEAAYRKTQAHARGRSRSKARRGPDLMAKIQRGIDQMSAAAVEAGLKMAAWLDARRDRDYTLS